jgi:SAM-dependent methyltransferase
MSLGTKSFGLETARTMELEAVRTWFRPASKVLEIGGGNGYQAGIISSWGCAVVAVDVACPRGETYRKSVLYDGVKLPVREHSIDLVFSSNVLEHVEVPRLAPLLEEVKRALKPEGRVVCIVPTATWRLWTSLSHYPFCLQYLLGRRAVLGGHSPDLSSVLRKRGVLATLSRTVIPGPHGVSRNALSELVAFRRARWHRLFVTLGFRIVAEHYSGLFYTGSALFPRMGVEGRRKLARLLGSACSVFILELRQPAS